MQEVAGGSPRLVFIISQQTFIFEGSSRRRGAESARDVYTLINTANTAPVFAGPDEGGERDKGTREGGVVFP